MRAEIREEILNLVKHNINWKYINYLTDKLTEYEDSDFYIRIKVSGTLPGYGEIYVYDTQIADIIIEYTEHRISRVGEEAAMDNIRKIFKNLYYNIYIWTQEDRDVNHMRDTIKKFGDQTYYSNKKDEFYNDFYRKIESKSKLITLARLRLTVQPKQ